MAAGNASLPDAGLSAGSDADAGAGPFVINLTSSTSPMALAHPEAPELKRFSFFVSRRREDNRERFRLHMGYFATLAEAEEWLNVIRDLYPGAWAGEAPGKKLRARAAAAELAKQLPPPPPFAASAAPRPAAPAGKTAASIAAIPASVAPPVAARPTMPATMPPAAELVVPTLQAAPAIPPAPHATTAVSAAPMLEAVAQAAAALAAAAKTVAGAQAASPPISFTYAPPPVAPTATPAAAAAAAAKAAGAAAQKSAAQISSSAETAGAQAAAPSKTAAPSAQAGVARAPSGPAVPGASSAQADRQGAERAAGSARTVSTQPSAVAPRATRAPAELHKPAVAAPSRPAAQSPAKGGKKNLPNALTEGSNVREVMASLDETGETRQMRIPPGLRAPAAPAATSSVARTSGGAAGPAQSARGSAPEPRAAAPASRIPSANSGATDSMSDTQVLRMLETRRPDDSDKGNDDANSGISLLKPDDTQTRRALKEAVIENAPVSFAVQLQWSVQPVDLASVPPLAIFSAYTLYTVEGSREGRKWYGLRLGFFSDAISAKQVAYYVRSEFNSVAVVPVSPAEKSRATDEETKAATGAFQRKNLEKKVEEFKLFDDEKLADNDAKAAAPVPAAKPATATTPSAPARKNKPLGRVRAKEHRSPKTLEETLEILGASDLEIDNGRGEMLNDTGVRHLRVEVQKNTPFSKLLDRISERVRKN
jgi:hypothetical protein